MDEGRHHETLLKFLSDSFPQFIAPQVIYEENSEENGGISYKARFKLLGQTFDSGPHGSKHDALESVSSVAFEVAKEFQTLVLQQTDASIDCEALSSLFRPLKAEARNVASTVTQEALRSVSEIKSRLIEVENENINLKVKSKSEKIIEKMQGTVQLNKPEPVMVSKIEKTIEPSVSNIEKADESPASNNVKSMEPPVAVSPIPSNDGSIGLSPLKIEESEKSVTKKTNIGAPIPSFYEFVEKQSSSEAIVFDDFIKGQNYGCRLRWGKRFWVAPAEYRQKKDAHNYAAVMACVELFGEGFTFEGVDPRIYIKWTRESVRKASDRYSFATSDELLANKASCQVPIEVDNIKIEPLTDGRKFLSVINEICQKMRFTPPNYQVASVNALTNYYVCTIKNFHDLPPVESTPFTKKNEAKEDAAGRVYYLLKQKGIVDEASRIIGRQKTLEIIASRTDLERSTSKRNDSTRNDNYRIDNRNDITRIDNRNDITRIDNRNDTIRTDDYRSTTNRPEGFRPNIIPTVHARPPYPPSAPIIPIVPSIQPPNVSPPMSFNQPMPMMPPNMNMMQMMPMFMMSQMAAQQSSMNPASTPTDQMPFDPQMMQNFEAMMNMTRQWQAFLAWQQQTQNAHGANNANNAFNSNSIMSDSQSSPPNASNSAHQPHHRQPPPSRDPRSNENNYTRKRYYEDEPPRRR